MSNQKTVQRLLLSYCQLPGLDSGMVDPQQRINVIHRLRPNIREFLDFGGRVLYLKFRGLVMTSYDIIGDPANLVIGQGKSKLFYSRLDRVPACEAVTSTPTLSQ